MIETSEKPAERDLTRDSLEDVRANDRPSLDVIRSFCNALDAEGIAYCHWKSNAMLDRSASGANDLDLLVRRSDELQFRIILSRMGFKEAQGVSEWKYPGIAHFYAYDAPSDKLVHVHAHYQLIIGHDRLKNYHLPIEKPFLKFTTQEDPFKVPVPELEFILFVIRMVLKRPVLDLGRRRLLGASENQELAYLLSRADQARVHAMLSTYLPHISAQLFDACAESLRPGCSSWKRIRAGRQLRHILRANRRYSWFVSAALRARRYFTAGIRRRVTKVLPRKRLVNGGLLVALVGGDGAGKTTASEGVAKWLSKDFDVIQGHLGKPPKSWVTFSVDYASKLAGLIGMSSRGEEGTQSSTDSRSYGWADYIQLLRGVCLARDRYRAYAKMRMFASNGGIVICDRYPLPQVKRMDAPRIIQMEKVEEPGKSLSLVTRFLAKMEKRYYRQILASDVVIVLRVPPDVAVQRKPEEKAESVRLRSQEIWELDWQHTNAHVVDANRSQAEVLSQLKTLIWSEL